MKIQLLLFLLTWLFIVSLPAQNQAIRQQQYNLDKNGLALEGYDPVSYFTEKKPQKGNEKWSYTYQNIKYHFSSAQNRDAFIKNPNKYEPAYGGWCAWAIAQNGEKVNVNPLVYKISDGRLLLFYKNAFYNALNSWNKDQTKEADLLNKGDEYWNNIIKK